MHESDQNDPLFPGALSPKSSELAEHVKNANGRPLKLPEIGSKVVMWPP